MARFKRFFIAFSAVLFILSSVTFVMMVNDINKSYTNSEGFKTIFTSFKSDLYNEKLNLLPKEEAIKKLNVSSEQIEEYRTAYGSLSEQIESIENQYVDQIEDARTSNSEKVRKKLEKERDEKITDIKQNFEDDNYVEKKILKLQKQAVESYYEEAGERLEELKKKYGYFSYDLTNERTKENIKSGEVNGENYFQMNYTSKRYGAFYDTYGRSPIHINYDENQEYLPSNISSFDLPEGHDVYTGKIAISEQAVKQADFNKSIIKYDLIKKSMYILWGLTIILDIIAVFLLWKNRKIYKHYNWPLEIQLIIAGFLSILAILIGSRFAAGLNDLKYYENAISAMSEWATLIIVPIVLWVLIAWAIVFIMSIFNGGSKKEILANSLSRKILKIAKDLFLDLSITFQVIIYLIIVFLAGFGLAIFVSTMDANIFLIYLLLFLVFVAPTSWYFFKQLGDLNKIVKTTDDIVRNKQNETIHLQGFSNFKEHADKINELQTGIIHSRSEQNKSERMKTELITNVSHDLRTPLTSIITYTELLKNDALSTEERASYVEVLDKKSQRLKTLIDDLFEVSKMASGNIELHKQDVNISQLIQQALGEYESEIEKTSLRFNTTIPNEEVIINIDGQRYWRIIDNLISNAIKYSLDGTRIFIDLDDLGDRIQLTVKNISKYEISEDVDELYERFKRADSSRHTEGSGLGLAIAQSIVDLHGGNMEIKIDGDLFKVIVTQPK